MGTIGECDLYIRSTDWVNNRISPYDVDDILIKHKNKIKDFGYLTNDINNYQIGGATLNLADKANLQIH